MKSRKKISKKKKILDKKFLIFSAGIIVIVLGLVYYKVYFQNSEIKFSLNAAIIDQLGKDFPDAGFNNTVTNLLTGAGFNVSYYKSEGITVDFYKGLAKYNYGIIILRTHSALRNQTPPIVDIFTSENYTEARANELIKEQSMGLLSKGEYLWTPGKYYFAITPKFIESLEGYFPKSIVIAMGCWSLKLGSEEMATAFINKGAKAYIGWTDLVYPEDTDSETVKLLKLLIEDDNPLGNATSRTSPYTYPSYGVTTHLDFYPKSTGNLRISELIKEAKASITLRSTVNSFEPLLSFFCIREVINYKSKDFEI